MLDRYWAIGDIHGEFDKLKALLEVMKANGFDLNDPHQFLIQLGDRNDRGKKSYEVNEFLKQQELMYPKQVINLLGNHDRMLLDVVENRSDLMYYNGGNQTQESYGKAMKIYGKHGFANAARKSGHYDWMKTNPLYHETPDYFFSHAPIPLAKYMSTDRDFRLDEHTLTWTYIPGPETEWVDPQAVPKDYGNDYKITVYGHIHSGYYDQKTKSYKTPNPRKIGNAILLDSGSGCWKEAVLSAIDLSTMTIYQSDGKIFKL